MSNETILYIKDNNGAIREWGIKRQEDTIVIRHGQQGGAMQYQYEDITEGKGGRDIDEQILMRMASRVGKQRDKGYVNMLSKVGKTVNLLGLPKPMRAAKFRDVEGDIEYDQTYVQRKYDGNRCLIAKRDGINIAYTRNGKQIHTIGHILKDIILDEGQIVDGELYAHGFKLQTIVSWAKREQENTKKLKYHMYDTIADEPFYRRLQTIKDIQHGGTVIRVPTTLVRSIEQVMSQFQLVRHQNYEGLILRWGKAGYEDNKRSKSLVKIKEWQDDEFRVIAVHESKDGWGILECEMDDGNRFRVSAPGTIEQKMYALIHQEEFIGRYITVEYAMLTKDGIPFHPVATIWSKHS